LKIFFGLTYWHITLLRKKKPYIIAQMIHFRRISEFLWNCHIILTTARCIYFFSQHLCCYQTNLIASIYLYFMNSNINSIICLLVFIQLDCGKNPQCFNLLMNPKNWSRYYQSQPQYSDLKSCLDQASVLNGLWYTSSLDEHGLRWDSGLVHVDMHIISPFVGTCISMFSCFLMSTCWTLPAMF